MKVLLKYIGTVWMLGVNIYPKENDLPLLIFATDLPPATAARA
jgi:hypothetical protein